MIAAPRLLAAPVTVALLVGAATVQAAEIVYNRQATVSEIAAVRVVAPEIIAQAEAAPPWQAWAADGAYGRVTVRIEAGAVCGATGMCPAYFLVDGKVVWRGMLPERANWLPR